MYSTTPHQQAREILDKNQKNIFTHNLAKAFIFIQTDFNI